MKRRAPLLIALLALLAGAVAAALLLRPGAPTSSGVALGAPFSLTDPSGRTVTDRDLRGRPVAMFFGFTYCPEVCPTTLARHTAALKALGKDADKLRVVFVTVDPERDTPAQLGRYLSDFDPRIVGLTGSPTAVAAMLKSYGVFAKKVPLEGGGYTMDHISATYLLDRAGGLQGLIAYTDPPPVELAKLRNLIAGRAPGP